MNIAILTLGCKTNQAESMQIQRDLIKSGHKIVNISEMPDICIINTCTVTAKADYQSRQLINKALKKGSKVIVTGCYSELNSDYIAKRYNIEMVPNSKKSNIINIIPKSNLTFNLNTSFNNNDRHRPIVKVQEGCNYSCSYCTIPLARGRSKSIEPSKVIEEVTNLALSGYKEIVLSGTHLGLYGFDLKPKVTLSKLIMELLIKTSIPRIRLSSIEINEIDEELLEIMSDKRICNHLHIPLQSGDDNILKYMNRTYTTRDFIKRMDTILNRFPDISIGTDIIVGFPGEDEDRFFQTKSLLNLLPFSYLHIFPYSERPNTRALYLNDKVKDATKKRRVAELKEIDKIKRSIYIKKNIGIKQSAVSEKRYKNGIFCTTSNYIKVLTEDKSISEGSLVDIVITGYKEETAIGKLIKN